MILMQKIQNLHIENDKHEGKQHIWQGVEFKKGRQVVLKRQVEGRVCVCRNHSGNLDVQGTQPSMLRLSVQNEQAGGMENAELG